MVEFAPLFGEISNTDWFWYVLLVKFAFHYGEIPDFVLIYSID